MFNTKEFFDAHNINYITEGHKHTQSGWIQIVCPFCSGNPGWHLGFNTASDFFSCWRCGFHSNIEVIHELLTVSWSEAKKIIKEYETHFQRSHKQEYQHKATTVAIPSNSKAFGPSYIEYMKRRRFNIEDTIHKWQIVAGGPYGTQRHRIIIPIIYNNRIVSYQGRDITGKSEIKYKACEKEKEIIHHKNILYGLDHAKNSCILVEGVTDVWRMGYGAIATFGIKTKMSQIYLLAERFREVYIMFDNGPKDKPAQKAAQKIAYDLSALDVKTTICLIDGDPGDLSQSKADQYRKELIG